METSRFTCPACSHSRKNDVRTGVYECKKCGAIYGSCYLGDSYALVKPFWHTGESRPEQERYFDLDCLGSAGITRRHGWFNTETRLLTQVG